MPEGHDQALQRVLCCSMLDYEVHGMNHWYEAFSANWVWTGPAKRARRVQREEPGRDDNTGSSQGGSCRTPAAPDDKLWQLRRAEDQSSISLSFFSTPKHHTT